MKPKKIRVLNQKLRFKQVLINADHDAVLANIAEVFTEFKIEPLEKSKYCNKAYIKLKKASLDNFGFDLRSTDLAFKRNHRTITLESGEQRIAKLSTEAPDLPIMVYSMKDQL